MSSNLALICVTHKATGCFQMVYTGTAPAKYRARSLVTYINNYAQYSIQRKLENWALKEFADAYAPVREEDFTVQILIPEFVAKEKCKEMAAAQSRRLGPARLLSSRILPSTLWPLNAEAKERVMRGQNIYRSGETTPLSEVNFPLSLVENFLSRYDSGFTVDAMRQLRRQAKQYREQACLSKSTTESTQ